MKQTQAIIERVIRVSDTHQRLQVAADASLLAIKAGQSVLARVNETYDPYLREQWYPVGVTKTALIIERPINQHYEPGQVIDLIGLAGQPYRFRRTLRNTLLVAYDTPPTPLLLAVAPLLANKISVTLLLLGSAAQYSTNHLPAEVEILHGDGEMDWANRVTTVGWADQVFVVVNPQAESIYMARVLQTFRELRSDVPKDYLFGVFQPPLPCGLGACGACLVRTKGAPLAACTDGPAFDLTQISL